MKHFTALLMLALLLVGCSREAVGNTGDLVISGQVQNWQASYGSTLNAVGGTNEALGSGSIDAQGNFSVTASPPFYTLGNIEPCQNASSTIVSSPESLRVSSVRLEIAKQEAGFVLRSDTRGLTQEAIYVYADQPGTVQGQVECTGRYDNTMRYDLNLVNGWNLVLVDIQTVDENSVIATYSSADEADVATFNWYAYVP